MLDRLGIEKWDLVLIGDGSGSQWKMPCGWATVAIERRHRTRKVFYGAVNHGTVNFAEMMAYVQPLTWYLQKQQKARKKAAGRARRMDRRIHIITDSAYCANRGESRDLSCPVHRILWGTFELIRRQGLHLEWHWEKRNRVELNTYADRLSKVARCLIQEHDKESRRVVNRHGSEYDLNPWE
jgi:ribonuclease HI